MNFKVSLGRKHSPEDGPHKVHLHQVVAAPWHAQPLLQHSIVEVPFLGGSGLGLFIMAAGGERLSQPEENMFHYKHRHHFLVTVFVNEDV